MPDETSTWGKPADPATKECDFCGPGSTAAYAVPVYKTAKQRKDGVRPGQFLYACPKHHATAKRAAESRIQPREAA